MSPTRKLSTHFFALLFLAACGAASAAGSVTLPQNCIESCIAPYGEALGTTEDGVKAFSNCQSSCVVFDPNQENGIYSGIKWQCVEFTRRWLIRNRGLTFGDVDVAADMWKLNSLTRLTDQSPVPLETFVNGAKTAPKRGDLIIYAKEYLGTGHAAIVLDVNARLGRVRVAEQNFNNKKWPARYARSIDLINKNGHYWLLDAYLLGWMRAQ